MDEWMHGWMAGWMDGWMINLKMYENMVGCVNNNIPSEQFF